MTEAHPSCICVACPSCSSARSVTRELRWLCSQLISPGSALARLTSSCLAVGRKELSGGARFTDPLKIKQTAFASIKLWGRLVCEVTVWPKNNFVNFYARRWPWLSDPW